MTEKKYKIKLKNEWKYPEIQKKKNFVVIFLAGVLSIDKNIDNITKNKW